jgi:hypothetical protein
VNKSKSRIQLEQPCKAAAGGSSYIFELIERIFLSQVILTILTLGKLCEESLRTHFLEEPILLEVCAVMALLVCIYLVFHDSVLNCLSLSLRLNELPRKTTFRRNAFPFSFQQFFSFMAAKIFDLPLDIFNECALIPVLLTSWFNVLSVHHFVFVITLFVLPIVNF